MLRNQEKLLNLPIPPLNNLLEFSNWIKPIVNDKEFSISQEALEEFLILKGDGEKLQKKLIEVSSDLRTSWLEPLWIDMYLEYREKLVSNMNYYGIFDSSRIKSSYDLATLGAKITYEIMNEYLKISSKILCPEYIKNHALCMEQYNYLFKSVRIPKANKDIYRIYPYTKDNHLVLYYNNNIYKVDICDSEGAILSIDILASKINSIIEKNIEDKGDNIGVLTTLPRNQAAKLYEDLEKNSVNKSNLDIINKALFVLCIDPSSKDLEDLQRKMLISDGKNRYFDKNCQVVISKNLDIGFNNEHTRADATPWFSIMNRVFNKIIEDANQKINTFQVSLPEEIKWKLSEDIECRLKDQVIRHQDFSRKMYISNLKFSDFGKNHIKSLNMSPDAFFQICLQVAQYITFGELRSTYEAVSMRKFKGGRTECARAGNEHVLSLAVEISSNNYSKDRIRDLFIKAQKKHIDRIKKCQEGFGIERHLFGLYKIYEKYGEEIGVLKKPSLYDSPGYNKLKDDYISTSGLSFESLDLFGFGPVVEDGYGIGYIINEEAINISISTNISNKNKAIELIKNIKKTYLTLGNIQML